MAKIGIVSCAKIKDHHCIACLKCFKAMKTKEGEFAAHNDDIEVVFMSDCGGCPGLTIPKVMLVDEQAKSLGRDYDVIHIGTCVVKAATLSGCPIDPQDLAKKLEGKFGKKVIIGTHNY